MQQQNGDHSNGDTHIDDDNTTTITTTTRICCRCLVTASFVSILIVNSPSVECTFFVLFLMLLYVWLNSEVQKRYPGTIELDGNETFLFRLYVALIHDAMAGFMLLLILSLHYFNSDNGGISLWLRSDWDTMFVNDTETKTTTIIPMNTILNTLDYLSMCGTMAYEMKDGIVDDFSLYSQERVGIYIHHVATVGMCLYILNCEYGRGYMILNGLQCLVGSSIYCIWRLKRMNTVLYCMAMTASNAFGSYLNYKYCMLALFSHNDTCYTVSILVGFIAFVRQYPVMEIIIKHLILIVNTNNSLKKKKK